MRDGRGQHHQREAGGVKRGGSKKQLTKEVSGKGWAPDKELGEKA